MIYLIPVMLLLAVLGFLWTVRKGCPRSALGGCLDALQRLAHPVA